MSTPEYTLLPDLFRVHIPDPDFPERKISLDVDIVGANRRLEKISRESKLLKDAPQTVEFFLTGVVTYMQELAGRPDLKITETAAWNFFTATRAAFEDYKKKLENSLSSLLNLDSTASPSPNPTDQSSTETEPALPSFPRFGKGE